jgi:hypothetical protein
VLAQWLVADVFAIRTYLVQGDTVVALGFQEGSVRPSGKRYAFDFVHVWTVVDGKISSFRVYYDSAYVGGLLRQEGSST